MSRYVNPTPEQEQGWSEWIESRPKVIQDMARRFDPWSLYRLKTTNQRVTVAAFDEDGTMSVNVLAEFNFVLHERQVFGIDPNDLEPCDPPGPNEPVGALMSSKETDDNIDFLRVLIRPDLWKLNEEGKAVRRDGEQNDKLH